MVSWSTSWLRTMAMVIAVAAIAVLGFLFFRRYLLVPATIILLAGVLTYLLQPLVEWSVRITRLRRVHMVRVSVVLFLYLVIAASIYVFGSVTVQAMRGQVRELQFTWAGSQKHVPQQLVDLQQWYVNTVPMNIQRQIRDSVDKEFKRSPDKYIPKAVSLVMGIANSVLGWLGLIIELIFVPLVAFYFLTDSAKVREQMLFFIPGRHRETVITYAGGMDQIMREYVRGQLVLCTIAWLAVTIAMLLMGIPGALLLGLIAGVSRAIPVIGPVVGGVPVLAAVLLTPEWSHAFWWVLVGFTALHLFESKFLMPRILGDHLGVHPVLVIVSLLIGYELMGLLGMFLAPPVVAIVRFILAMHRQEQTPDAQQEQLALPAEVDSAASPTG